MIVRRAVHAEAVNRTLKDLRNSDGVMSGVTYVFAGDFRQTLPVITEGTRADVIRACFYSWSFVETLNLRTNMRAHLSDSYDNDFPHQLLNLRDGKISCPSTDDIKLDDSRFGHILHIG